MEHMTFSLKLQTDKGDASGKNGTHTLHKVVITLPTPDIQ